MEPVELVMIEGLIPIYKNGEAANVIEVARIKTSEVSLQFNIVVGKGLYKIGDKVIYIQPDHCVPNTDMFREYYEPFGDKKKSKLGKKGRIRAVKFNFQFENEPEPIYSNGIILPLDTFKGGLDFSENLQKQLQIIKYVADDSNEGQSKGLIKGERPYFLYETDETRIETLKEYIDSLDEELGFTLKRDGSSITLYYINLNGEYSSGICSRNLEKKLDQQYKSAYKDGDYILHPYLNKETNVRGWYNDFTETFYTDEQVEQFEPIMKEVRDAWVDVSKKYGYLDKLIKYYQDNNVQLALRGELIGSGNKGTGNKYNIDAKGDSRVIWFGVDDLSSGMAVRINYSEVHNLKSISEALELDYTQELFSGKFNYDQIIKICNEYFKKVKEESGQIVEGIVIRSKYSNRLSAKYINPEYDSKM